MYVVLCILVTAVPVLCTVLDLKDYKNDKPRPSWSNEFPDLMDQPFFNNEKPQTTPRRTIMTRLSIDLSNTDPVGTEFVTSDSTEVVNTNPSRTLTGRIGYYDQSSTASESVAGVLHGKPPGLIPGQDKEASYSEVLPPSGRAEAPDATEKQGPSPEEVLPASNNDEEISPEPSSSSTPKSSTTDFPHFFNHTTDHNDLNGTLVEIFSKMSHKDCSQLIRYPPDPNQICLTMEFIMTENRHYAGAEDLCTRIQLETYPDLVDGRPTEKTEATYQISIRRQVKDVFVKHCAGALVTSRFVLTAAICVTDISTLTEYHVVGGPGAQELDNDVNMDAQFWRQICCYYLHKYLPHVFYRDIAVLEVSKPFKLSALLSPIKIAGLPRTDQELATNSANRCLLTKYTNRLKSATDSPSTLNPERLHLACVPLMSFHTCNKQFRVMFGMSLNNETDLCVGTATPSTKCYGEPGSPLVCGGSLVGVATAVHPCGKSPGLFTQVPGSILRMTLLAESADNAGDPITHTKPKLNLYMHILFIYLLIKL